MAEVVKLVAGDTLPDEGEFLVVTRLSRPRVFEYFIDVSPALEPKVGRRIPPGGPGYASLETALNAAQELAGRILEKGAVVIDVGSDFRFRDPIVYEQWYGQPRVV